MSLTSFIDIKDIKNRFRDEFPKPKLALNKSLLAPPLTKQYALVGAAFDYLLRFYIERLNPRSISSQWVAKKALKTIDSYSELSYDLDEQKLIEDTSLYDKAEKLLCRAELDYSKYLKSGKVIKGLINSCMLLAQLESLRRGWEPDDDFIDRLGTIDEKDLKDLKKLLSIVDPNIFKSKHICILNPTFGKASQLVGGADADLIIDDMIIEIKTTKNHSFLREYFHQLIGYYILYRIGNVDGLPNKHKIKRLGIYYSRFGYLYTFDIKDVINNKTFPTFLKWFKERADYIYNIRKKLHNKSTHSNA